MPKSTFTSDNIPDLTNQIIIVTGGNAGLGLETIRQLRRHGPERIYMASRSEERAKAAIEELEQSEPKGAPVVFLKLDLGSLASVKAAAEHFLTLESRLDILVNNAGIMMTPEGLTVEGYEIQFGTNVLGPALFTELLLPLIKNTAANKSSPQARVVFVASGSERLAHADAFDKHRGAQDDPRPPQHHARYTTSKIANVYYAQAMAEKHSDSGVKFIAVHPGMVATKLNRNSTGIFLRPFLSVAIYFFATPVEKGALSQIWASVSPDAKSGEYYGPVALPAQGSKASKNRDQQEKVYAWIEKQISPFL